MLLLLGRQDYKSIQQSASGLKDTTTMESLLLDEKSFCNVWGWAKPGRVGLEHLDGITVLTKHNIIK
ncbi:hypothetical protein E2C01_006178 [Portunus trituberculatus]|uniref:Uncharacterized protein n=1 Tax=Portunus trituberculatus TaxID=210409 RepID=A0A5B7D133_PORTR|nr:hypothetical protein [Portunus trituberculatus]